MSMYCTVQNKGLSVCWSLIQSPVTYKYMVSMSFLFGSVWGFWLKKLKTLTLYVYIYAYRTCMFCGLKKEEFKTQSKMNAHYSKECPMLYSCPHCSQVCTFIETTE